MYLVFSLGFLELSRAFDQQSIILFCYQKFIYVVNETLKISGKGSYLSSGSKRYFLLALNLIFCQKIQEVLKRLS